MYVIKIDQFRYLKNLNDWTKPTTTLHSTEAKIYKTQAGAKRCIIMTKNATARQWTVIKKTLFV